MKQLYEMKKPIKVDFYYIIKFWHCILLWNNVWRDYTGACSLHYRGVAYNGKYIVLRNIC